MKEPHKYLIQFILIAIVFICGSNNFTPAISEADFDYQTTETISCEFDSPISDTDMFLAHRTSRVNAPRQQSTAKRTSKIYKNIFASPKAGKITDIGTNSILNNQSLGNPYPFIRPVNRLTLLGKLII